MCVCMCRVEFCIPKLEGRTSIEISKIKMDREMSVDTQSSYVFPWLVWVSTCTLTLSSLEADQYFHINNRLHYYLYVKGNAHSEWATVR